MRRVFIWLLIVVSAHAFGQGRVLGNLGQTLEATRIYAAPNTKSHVFYTAKQYQYLIVSNYTENYHKVVMSNGVYGYARASKVAVLPQVVRQSTQTSSRAVAAKKGLNYIGTPYVWGGDNITSGIDCSGFVKKLYGDIGIDLPRTAAEQAKVGTPIRRLEDLRAGDRLYFWEKKRATIGHTGLYLGNGYFVHSSRGHNGVNTDRLSERWQRILVAARR